MPAECLVGFHPVEEWQGARFRWSGPVAIVRLALAPGAYRVAIDTRDIRPDPAGTAPRDCPCSSELGLPIHSIEFHPH